MPSPRQLLTDLYGAAVAGASPEAATRAAVMALEIPAAARVHIIAIGKASLAMSAGAAAAIAASGATLSGGVAVAAPPPRTPAGAGAADRVDAAAASPDVNAAHVLSLRVVVGDHPIPGSGSFSAAMAIADAVSHVRADDRVLALISGGASSLAAAPAPEVPGLAQPDIGTLNQALLKSGADIHVVNAVRKRFMRWTGGRLAVALAPAQVDCIAVSDVPGDDLGMIGSGPCIADPMHARELVTNLRSSGVWSSLPPFAQQHLEAVLHGRAPETPKADSPAFRHVTARVIVSNHQALEAAATRARTEGIDEVVIEGTLLAGEASIVGVRTASDLIARRKRSRGPRVTRCVLWGGETTVTIRDDGNPPGQTERPLGGRSQELALAAARSLADAGEQADGITILAAGTDGRDGPTDAAGAIVDQSTWAAISDAGRDPADDLARHNAYRALDAAKVLLRPGLTGTNVMDVVIGLLL